MKRVIPFALLGVAVVAGAVSYGPLLGYLSPTTERVRPLAELAWIEVPWPFSAEPWGAGRAFRCNAADCGTEIVVYLRAKIGFCDCTNGVADDDHLDRIGDVDLVAGRAALGPGHPISVRSMKGRTRGYAADGKSVLSLAFNDRCDVIVATAASGTSDPSAYEATVLQFLNSDLVFRWAEKAIGL